MAKTSISEKLFLTPRAAQMIVRVHAKQFVPLMQLKKTQESIKPAAMDEVDVYQSVHLG